MYGKGIFIGGENRTSGGDQRKPTFDGGRI